LSSTNVPEDYSKKIIEVALENGKKSLKKRQNFEIKKLRKTSKQYHDFSKKMFLIFKNIFFCTKIPKAKQ